MGTASSRTARKAQPALVLAVATATWTGVVLVGRGMGTMPGTMGLGLAEFLALWTLMMAAMMLPSVAPFASFYTGTFGAARRGRFAAFGLGYLVVWAAVGVPAFAVATAVDDVVVRDRTAATVLAAAIFTACGVYQLTPWKDRCLTVCRSPLGLVLRFGSTGRARDLRIGVAHGAFCVACCWALMLLLFAFGLMNLVAMVVLAGVVVAEKASIHGFGIARLGGALALLLAVLVVVHPAIATGLYHTNMTMHGSGM